MSDSNKYTYAIWAITPNGVNLAKKIAIGLSDVDIFVSDKLTGAERKSSTFRSLSETLAKTFYQYTGHIFIMSTGIVVRVIAPLIRSKTQDPAIVVIDDQGNHAISLLSGHLGGANALTIKVAELIGAKPVITTATDVNRIVAIDVLAKEKQLYIEQKRFEHSILLIPTPEAVISEGIGNTAADVLFSDEEKGQIILDNLCHNPSSDDLDEIVYRYQVLAQVSLLWNNLAIYAHEDGWSDEELVKYSQNFGFVHEKNIRQILKMIRHPLWSTYIFKVFNITKGYIR